MFHRLIGNKGLRLAVNAACGCFAVLMVIARLLSGVHWLTDIFGGALLSAGLVMLYVGANRLVEFHKKRAKAPALR